MSGQDLDKVRIWRYYGAGNGLKLAPDPKGDRTMADTDIRYNLTLSEEANQDLEGTAALLGTSKADALRRAVTLLKHAVQADKVELTTKGGEKQSVLLK
jgi:hypothetical protein